MGSGSARAAAEEIGLSPSALSRRISNLEEFVGKKLFTRARQSMQLTDEGQAFYEAVNPHMEALARADHGWLDRLITRREPLDRWQAALRRDRNDIKTVIDFTL